MGVGISHTTVRRKAGKDVRHAPNPFGRASIEGLEPRVLLSAAASYTFNTIAVFTGNSGSTPNGNLIVDSSGNIYGTTQGGGSSDSGTVFKVSAGSGTVMTVASLGNPVGATPAAGVIRDSSGNLFGTTTSAGTLFEIGVSGAPQVVAPLPVGASAPFTAGPLLEESGVFDGATQYCVFQITPGGTSVLTTFADSANGLSTAQSTGISAGIVSGLVMDTDGNLFGTTSRGGANDDGLLFEYRKSTGMLVDLADFTNASGNNAGGDPIAGLAIDSSNVLYGTTSTGGVNGFGAIFKYDPNTSAVVPLAPFYNTSGVNGSVAPSNVVVDSSGNLFGTTAAGGEFGDGSVFELASGSTSINSLLSFNGNNGSSPTGVIIGPTVSGLGPILYGTTGTPSGTLFQLTPSATVTTHLAFVQEPSNVVYPNSVSGVGVALVDQNGTYVPSTITLSINTAPDGFSPPMGVPVTATATLESNNIVLFPAFSLSTFGSYSLLATASGASPTVSANFTVSPPSQAAGIVFSSQISTTVSQTAGSTLTDPIVVEVVDANGRPVVGDNSSITLGIASGPGATLSGTTTQPVNNGFATFDDLSINSLGNFSLFAIDSSEALAGIVSAPFTVAAPPPATETLTPVVTSLKIGTPIATNDVLRGSALVSVTNKSTIAQKGAMAIKIFACPDAVDGTPVIDDASQLASLHLFHVNLAPKASTTFNLKLGPFEIFTPGQFSFLAETIGPDTAAHHANQVTVGVTGITENVATGSPNLNISNVSLAPIKIKPNGSGTASFTVSNLQSGITPIIVDSTGKATVTIGVYNVTPPRVLDAAHTLDTLEITLTVKALKSKMLHLHFKDLGNVPAGTYRATVQIAIGNTFLSPIASGAMIVVGE